MVLGGFRVSTRTIRYSTRLHTACPLLKRVILTLPLDTDLQGRRHLADRIHPVERARFRQRSSDQDWPDGAGYVYCARYSRLR